MQYTNELVIDAPLETVVEEYTNSNNLKKWQKDLKTVDLIFGEEKVRGSRYELTYDNEGNEKKVKQTIVEIDLPTKYSVKYESNNLYRFYDNEFYETDDGKTKWKVDVNFTYTGIMAPIGFFLKKKSTKKIEDDMNNFKNYIENQN